MTRQAVQPRTAVAETSRRFCPCGGDGTVNEVANGIIGYDNASMTVIPVGTGNDFLKNLCPEDMEKFRDAENLWDAPQFPIDAIDVNGRIALTIACSGIDARVAKDVHNFSESPILDGKSSYIVSLMVNFLFKGIGSHWTVELDGEAAEDDYALFFWIGWPAPIWRQPYPIVRQPVSQMPRRSLAAGTPLHPALHRFPARCRRSRQGRIIP